MSRKKLPTATPFQRFYEKSLLVLLMVLAAFHFWISFARHFFAPENMLAKSDLMLKLIKIERWYALALLAIALIYLILSKTKFGATWYRVKAWMKGVASAEGILLTCLFFYYIFCCYIQSKSYSNIFLSADFFLFDTAVMVFVLFTLPLAVGAEKAKRYVDIILHIVMAFSTVFIVWALWNVMHLNLLTLPNGLQLGMTEEYRLYLGVNSNIGAAICFSMVLICLYMIATHRWPIRLVYSVVLLPHLFATYLTNSRACYLAMMFAFPLFVFMLLWTSLQKRGLLLRILVCGIAAGITAVCVWLLRKGVFALFESITHLAEQLGIDDIAREIGVEQARVKIWRSSLGLMVSDSKVFFCGIPSPLIPNSICEKMTEIYGDGSVFAHAHNIILQTGLITGVPGMLVFLAFLVKLIFPSVKIGIGRYQQKYPGSYVLPIMILAILIVNMFEPFIMFYLSVMGCLFFLFSGYIVAISKDRLV